MRRAQPTELLLEALASLWLACCAGFSLAVASGGPGSGQALIPGLIGGIAAGLVAYKLLVGLRSDRLPLPSFAAEPLEEVVRELGFQPLEELLLTPDMERLRAELHEIAPEARPVPVAETELLLEDVLPRIRGESRVIQMFGHAAPTPGELKSRIDRHLNGAGRVPPLPSQPDASQALYDALADLRRSLS